MSTRTKHVAGLFLAVVLMALATAVVLVFAKPSRPLSSDAAAQHVAGAQQYNVPIAQEDPPVQLEGRWTAKFNETAFVAQVTGTTITIDIVSSDDTSMSYWNGTFKPSEAAGHSIMSNANADEIVLSQDSTKAFQVGENSLSFQFAAMGLKKTVVLSR